MAVPPPIAVTRPLVSTVATEVLLDVHVTLRLVVPVETVATSVIWSPTFKLVDGGVTVMVPSGGSTSWHAASTTRPKALATNAQRTRCKMPLISQPLQRPRKNLGKYLLQ
ncbi:MAG TPA: hypothetical protein VKP00_05030 [Gemmatimonadaceae bacterium]|nr:hypothetical protein [Gemmatimonadaceae bacterium]